MLPGDDPRGKEEQQLTRCNRDVVPFEQMANQGEAPEQRYLLGGDVLGGDYDSSDHDRAPVRHKNLRLFRLRVQCRNALNARNTLVDLGILDQHVHEHGALRGDLRCHFQFEDGIDELDRNRIVDRRLDGDFLTLLNDGFFVVLRNDARFREQFYTALGFGGGYKEVYRKIRRTMPQEESAGGGC